VLFDGDNGFEIRAKALGKSAENIKNERIGHVKANRSALKYFGHVEEDFPAAMVGDHVSIFEDHLESFLAVNWPEWEAACKNMEIASGINLAKNQLAYRTATLHATGALPGMLQEILAKAQGR
jgi:hypothetical protein